MKLFKTLLLLIVSTTVISSCEPEFLDENSHTLQVQSHKNYKDLIDDKKDILDIRDAIPISIDSILVN